MAGTTLDGVNDAPAGRQMVMVGGRCPGQARLLEALHGRNSDWWWDVRIGPWRDVRQIAHGLPVLSRSELTKPVLDEPAANLQGQN